MMRERDGEREIWRVREMIRERDGESEKERERGKEKRKIEI
jgi:hypothetical protein